MSRAEDLIKGLQELTEGNDVIEYNHWIMFFLGNIAGSIALIADEIKKMGGGEQE